MTTTHLASVPTASLKRGFLWSLLGNGVSLMGSWGLMMVMVHTGSPEMVGQYGIAMALVTPVMAFSNLQLRALQGTDARVEFGFGEYLSLRIISSVMAIVWLTGAISFSTDSATVQAVAIGLAAKMIVISLSDVYYGLFQQHERLDSIAQASMWSNGLNVVFFATAMLITGNLVTAVFGSAIACLLPLFVHNIPVARRLVASYSSPEVTLRPHWKWGRLWRLFLQALPLAIVSFLISLNANVPRYFLVDASGTEALGIFVALVSLLVASDTFTSAVAQTVSPRLAKYYVREDRAAFLGLLWRLERMAFLIGAVAVLLAYWVGPLVVSVIYQPVYAQERGAIVWLAVSAAVGMMSRFVANAITAARRLAVQVVSNGLSLAILTVGCALLIPRYGIEGATVAIAIASTMRFAFNLLVLSRVVSKWGISSALVGVRM